MNVVMGPQITLPTTFGAFDVQHVRVHRGEVFREGVLLRKVKELTPTLVRIQSSCLFSEAFWATDCDCARQLAKSLEIIANDGGIVLYFYEEGRGAGLDAKFKAIELQQARGLDTRAAYQCLNISVDTRSYDAAASVLKKVLGDTPITLLSNNPSKEKGLKDNGVNVVGRERLICGWEDEAIRHYLLEKRDSLGHDIP